MKRRILLLPALGMLGYITLTSNIAGPALAGNNYTGAKGSGTSCGPSGCHGSGTGTTVAIEVDSAGTHPVTKYVPGMVYTVKITGASTTGFAKFGFQYAVVSGTGASQVQAGACSGLPSLVASHAFSGLNFIEHSAPNTSATPGTYNVSFTWTAPTTGVGNITMYCTLNAVNGNGSEDAADKSGNVNTVLAQEAGPTAVTTVANNMDVTAFPNPFTNSLSLRFGTVTGSCSVSVYDISGKSVATVQTVAAASGSTASINTATWAPGVYEVVLQNGASTQVIPVVKQ